MLLVTCAVGLWRHTVHYIMVPTWEARDTPPPLLYSLGYIDISLVSQRLVHLCDTKPSRRAP